ncbi:MAG TPA: peptide-methionine (S)-S-oxide reductase MsrA [Candidatus Paceibacterota bacterium]|nr:peptide-methionine (S)-S-oxide reductase MsrA [Candidatus Paceibacterota bacterium]
MKTIVLGGGCFWCLDAIYKKVEGVKNIESGYAGGHTDSPTYDEVSFGQTGHAEVVRLTFDENIIDLKNILRIFFEVHDPTTMNAQGADIGTQYRSVVYYSNPEDENIINSAIEEAQNNFKNKIVTEVSPLPAFYLAEDYHQDYYAKNPNQPYCVAVISPKLEKFIKHK